MAPQRPPKRTEPPQISVRSTSRNSMNSKPDLPQTVKKNVATVDQKNAAVPSTSKDSPVASTSAPYQSTPKKSSVPVKPSRVASKSPKLLKERSSQPLSKRLQDSLLTKRQQSPHRKENRPPDTSPSVSSQTASLHHSIVTEDPETPGSSSRPRRHASVLARQAMNESSGGGRRQSTPHQFLQLSTFVRTGDEYRRRSSVGVFDNTDKSLTKTRSSPGSIGKSPKSHKKSPRRRTSHSVTALQTKRLSTSAPYTPVATVVNDTPGQQTGQLLNTPFRREAPKSARRRSPIPSVTGSHIKEKHTSDQIKLWEQQIRGWLHHTWKLCFMSASTAFEVQTQNMRTAYQNTLRVVISELFPFPVKVMIEPRHCFSRDPSKVDLVSITITFSFTGEWVQQSERESGAKRQGKKKGSTETTKTKTLYTGLLLRSDMKNQVTTGTTVTWYPLYFHSGRENIHHAVVGWMQDSFGSFVSQRCLRASVLMWAAGLWMPQPCGTARLEDKQKEQVILDYQLAGLSADGWQQHPRYANTQRTPDISRLTLEVPSSEIRRIALCILPDDNAEKKVTQGERDLFHCILQDLAHSLTKLPQSALRLRAVKTSCVSIKATGQIKLTCRRHLKGVLDFLLEMHTQDSLLDQVTGDVYEDLTSADEAEEDD